MMVVVAGGGEDEAAGRVWAGGWHAKPSTTPSNL